MPDALRLTSRWAMFFWLAALALLTRSVHFAQPVVDWDETEYLLVAQDMARGYLPYIHYWTTKAPPAFFAYALFVKLCGNNIVAIRIMGAIYIAAAAFIIYLAGRKLHSKAVGAIAAASVITLCSCIHSGGSIMTEHIALLPLAWAAYLICSGKAPAWQMGLAIGLAAVIRQNLIVLLPAGIYCHYCYTASGKKPSLPLSALAVTVWAAVPALATMAIYAASGHLRELYVITVQFGLRIMHYNGQRLADKVLLWTYIFTWRNFILIIALWLGIKTWRHPLPESLKDIRQLRLLFIFTAAAFISVMLTGDRWPHYNIQVMPFIFLAFAYYVALFAARGPKPAMAACFGLGLFFATTMQLDNIILFYTDFLASGEMPGKDRDISDITDFLRQHGVKNKYVFSPWHPIYNFLTESLHPIAPVSPLDYTTDERLKIYTGNEAYTLDTLAQEAFDKKPEYVITFPNEEFAPMEPYLNKLYTVAVNAPTYKIYALRH